MDSCYFASANSAAPAAHAWGEMIPAAKIRRGVLWENKGSRFEVYQVGYFARNELQFLEG